LEFHLQAVFVRASQFASGEGSPGRTSVILIGGRFSAGFPFGLGATPEPVDFAAGGAVTPEPVGDLAAGVAVAPEPVGLGGVAGAFGGGGELKSNGIALELVDFAAGGAVDPVPVGLGGVAAGLGGGGGEPKSNGTSTFDFGPPDAGFGSGFDAPSVGLGAAGLGAGGGESKSKGIATGTFGSAGLGAAGVGAGVGLVAACGAGL
jgi:hypothetical protein